MITKHRGASVSVQQSHFVSANSLVLSAATPRRATILSCAPIAGKGQDMQRDDWYSGQRDPATLASPEAIRRLCGPADAGPLGCAQVEDAQGAGTVRGATGDGAHCSFVHAVSGGSLYRKSSFLPDSLGQRVFPDFFAHQRNDRISEGSGLQSI